MSSPKYVQALGRTIYPYYYNTEGWAKKMIVDYSADWLIKKLGMWVTFFVQQTLWDSDLNYIDPILYSPAYYDPVEGRTVKISPEESDALGLSRKYDNPKCDLQVTSRPNDRFLFNINVSKSIGRGGEISFFVHNIFDDQAIYRDCYGSYQVRNPNIFYGVEFSMMLDDLLRRAGGEVQQ